MSAQGNQRYMDLDPKLLGGNDRPNIVRPLVLSCLAGGLIGSVISMSERVGVGTCGIQHWLTRIYQL